MEKTCSKCNLLLSLESFGKHKKGKLGRNSECKSCQSKREKIYKDTHKLETQEYNSQYNILNKEKKWKQCAEISKRKYSTDPIYRFKSNVRTHINVRLKNFLQKKKGKTLDYIGCDWPTYINHLESQFTPKMNWKNYGKYWEVDHILPLSKGGSFHYTNTQPLTVKENRKKFNKIIT